MGDESFLGCVCEQVCLTIAVFENNGAELTIVLAGTTPERGPFRQRVAMRVGEGCKVHALLL